MGVIETIGLFCLTLVGLWLLSGVGLWIALGVVAVSFFLGFKDFSDQLQEKIESITDSEDLVSSILGASFSVVFWVVVALLFIFLSFCIVEFVAFFLNGGLTIGR